MENSFILLKIMVLMFHLVAFHQNFLESQRARNTTWIKLETVVLQTSTPTIPRYFHLLFCFGREASSGRNHILLCETAI